MLIKSTLTKHEKQLVQDIKDYTESSNFKYDHVQDAISSYVDLRNSLDDRYDIGEETQIFDRDTIDYIFSSCLKCQLNDDGRYSSPTLQSLAFIDRNPDDYFYYDGINPVRLVTDEDVEAATEDVLDMKAVEA